MFSKAIALQFPEKGLRVNSICPGPIDTPLLHHAFPEKKEYDEYLETNPMKRAGTPEEVAGLALFLAALTRDILLAVFIRLMVVNLCDKEDRRLWFRSINEGNLWKILKKNF